MKESSFKSIIAINNFFEELNSDNKFFTKVLSLYFSDFVTCGLLLNTEYQSLLEKNLEELSIVNKEKLSCIPKDGGENPENRDVHYVEQIENLSNELMSASDFNYVYRVNEHEINQLKTNTLKTLLKVYMDQHLKNQKEKKEENLLVVDQAEEDLEDKDTENKTAENQNDPKLKYQNLLLHFDVLNSILRKSDSKVLRDRAFTTISQQNASHNYNKLKEILKARLAYAKSLGFSSYAEYQMQLNGIKIHPNKLIDYMLNLWIDLRPNMILEYSDLYRGIQKEKENEGKDEKNKTHNSNYDRNNNTNYILDSKYLLNYEVDSLRASLIDLNLKFIDEKIISKKFITIGNILNGMQMLTKLLFNLDLEAVMDEDHIKEDLMHESILITSLIQYKQQSSQSQANANQNNNDEAAEDNKQNKKEKEKIAKIYFDFFKREGKQNDVFSQFTIRGSKNLNLFNNPKSGSIRQTPIIMLATNFEVTELDLLNMPISFTDARNILHEFGHVLHASLSKTDFQSVSGCRVPLDFAEIPSHFMEYFIYEYSFCRNFMIDNKTNVAMDSKLHGLLSSQSQMFANLDLQETLHLSVFDLIVHSITDAELFEKGNLEFVFNSLIKYFYISSINPFDSSSFEEFEALLFKYKTNQNDVNLKFPIDRFFNILVEKSGSFDHQRGKNNENQSDYLAVLFDEDNARSTNKINCSNVNILRKINEIYKSKLMHESEEIENDKKEKSKKDKMLIENKHDIKFNFEVNEFIERKFEDEKFKVNRLEKEKIYNKNLSFTTIPHFKNYPASYYSYVIGKIFANLIWTEGFYKQDIDISRSGILLEKEYLSKGNTESSIKCIMNFLERLKKENKTAGKLKI